MKHIISISICLLFLSPAVEAQDLEYDFHPDSMVISRDGDTILHTADSRLLTQVSFRVRHPDDDAYLTINRRLNGANTPGIELTNAAGDPVIRLLTDAGGTGDARIVTDEILINGGSDLAELFEITNHDTEVEAGYLVSLDPTSPGKLKVSSEPYDKKVAGVVSGANGIKPGILMGQEDTMASGDDLVTLSGRTYVSANTTNGPIKIGDMITSSSVAGEAMRASNKKKSRGAVIGKAMTELVDGEGFILVLVNLQ